MAKSVTDKRQEMVTLATNEAESAMNKMMDLYEELEEIRSNLEEKFSQTERYQKLEEIIGQVDSIKETLSQAVDELQGLEVSYT